jgi:hypothetical protein
MSSCASSYLESSEFQSDMGGDQEEEEEEE